MKTLVLILAMFLNVSTAFAQRINTIFVDSAPAKAVYFGVSPVTSQLKLESGSAAGYTTWGFSVVGGYQSSLFDLFDTRVSLSFQRMTGGNNLNTATNREDGVSTGLDLQACALLFSSFCLGGGVQHRSVTLTQINGTTVQQLDLAGWLPFARATFDLIGAGAENALGLGLSAAYFSGTLESVRAIDLQASILLNYTFGIR